MTTTAVLDKDENLLPSMLQWALEIVITTKLRHYIVNLQPYFSTL